MDEAGSKVRQQLFEAVEDRSLREMQSDKVVCYPSLTRQFCFVVAQESHNAAERWAAGTRKLQQEWNIMKYHVK